MVASTSACVMQRLLLLPTDLCRIRVYIKMSKRRRNPRAQIFGGHQFVSLHASRGSCMYTEYQPTLPTNLGHVFADSTIQMRRVLS